MKLSTLESRLKILNNRLQVLAKLKVAKSKLMRILEMIWAVENRIAKLTTTVKQATQKVKQMSIKYYPENISLEDELKIIYRYINTGFIKLGIKTKEEKQGYVNKVLGRVVDTMVNVPPEELCTIIFQMMIDSNDLLMDINELTI